MSSNRLVSGYHMVIKAQGRPCKLERFGEFLAIDVTACPTSYSRNLASFSESSVKGREFIISSENLKGTDYSPPKKGDILTDTEMGDCTISSVTEMIILGQIAGYRVMTS